MACLISERVTVCVPTVDAWSRFYARCPVCRVRRLCLEESQGLVRLALYLSDLRHGLDGRRVS